MNKRYTCRCSPYVVTFEYEKLTFIYKHFLCLSFRTVGQ